MNIDLTKIKIGERVNIDEDINFDSQKFKHQDIVGLKNVHTLGYIYYNSAEILEINLNLTGVMLLKDSITLDILEHSFNLNIEEEYSLNDSYFQEYYENNQNILDILQLLWENIVLEVPMRITKVENANISGDGWHMGDNKSDEDNIDPRLEKLNKLLDDRKE